MVWFTLLLVVVNKKPAAMAMLEAYQLQSDAWTPVNFGLFEDVCNVQLKAIIVNMIRFDPADRPTAQEVKAAVNRITGNLL